MPEHAHQATTKTQVQADAAEGVENGQSGGGGAAGRIDFTGKINDSPTGADCLPDMWKKVDHA